MGGWWSICSRPITYGRPLGSPQWINRPPIIGKTVIGMGQYGCRTSGSSGKGLLDLGQGDKAQQIAHTALEVWKKEVEASYYCFEHFIVQSGRGAGWHQFSGLSTPVMAWYNAYHRPGRLTVGMDAWVDRQVFSDHQRALEADLRLNGAGGTPTTVLATMRTGASYQAQWNGQTAAFQEIFPGVLQVSLPNGEQGKLSITVRQED